ncbi:protein kinase [Archangium violaceum]|uniref:serine/threonine-protein kinase n=1 Tax=Archangium violaceum TaxID=83451 RepID=UPI00195274CA|nr:serine/threonine-protein kinase [Archangium violaceum]QRN96806.1 protein kinase [Archangium violaceum]
MDHEQSLLESGPFMPQALGPYQLQGVLGRGGMGVVYLGHHRDRDELVALKTVRVARESLSSNLRWEVRVLGRIQHPGVVRILDSGISGGLPWYAMELVKGRTLQQLIDRYWHVEGPPRDAASPVKLPVLPLLKLVRSLCSPLAYLHGCGLVHRDLKPGNVFVREDGTVVLGDLGVAAAFSGAYGRELLQVDDARLGTLLYMSPEQIQGDLVDARADLYSLGCILYECVTGFPPFGGGTSGAVRKRHLRQPPTPPSMLLDEPLPERLEWLILKLLEKRPQDRLGYAEDVDRVLAELGVEAVQPARLPKPRPYLYRSFFTGREDAVRSLRARLDSLSQGQGDRVFIGGGSGVGKTRLAMELAREAVFSELTVVTGECIPLGLSGTQVDATTRASPLHPFRPLLTLVADRCRAWGEAETERILGRWGKVLVPFEPSLDSLPGLRERPPPPPLANNEAERSRIFTSLQEVLFAFSEEESLLLILDDLQWADELTLGFLKRLRYEELVERGVLLLGTYRMEELSEPLHEVVSARALHLELGRLDASSIRSMVCGMLALGSLPPDFDGLVLQSEGNPFFVAEYLRAAITEGLLHRDASGQWRLVERAPGSLEALALPESIAEIINRRLGGLDARARGVVELAAVLGRELDAELLLRTVPLSESEALEALETLRVRQILEHVTGGRLRFIHDKLRELTYAGLSPERRRQLHHRSAEALEHRHAGERDFALLSPGLAHHWAKAEVHDRASRYFRLAGDRARGAYANEQAISFYQSALSEAELLPRPGAEGREEGEPDFRYLHESLGDLLALCGRQEEARAAYGGALARLSPAHQRQRAGLHRKLGKTWETHHQHEAALRAYDEAEAALGSVHSEPGAVGAEETASGWWHEWVQIQVERIWVYYWMGRVEEMGALIDKVRHPVEARGTSSQRVRFFQAILLWAFRRENYVLSAETVRTARQAVAASEQSGDLSEQATCRFFLAFSLLFHGDLEESERQGLVGLRLAERVGDLTLQSRLLTYLLQVYRRRGQVSEARTWSERSLRVATEARMDDYVGAALATRAWVAWKEQRLEDAERDARDAVERWRKLAERYSHFGGQWQGLLLLMAMESRRGEVAEAVERARVMLDPTQIPLPDPLAGALRAALEAWSQGQREAALEHLRRAVGVAGELRFL